MTALDDRWSEMVQQARQTIYCRPGQEDAVREALDLSGQAVWFDVEPCDTVPPGTVFIVGGQP